MKLNFIKRFIKQGFRLNTRQKIAAILFLVFIGICVACYVIFGNKLLKIVSEPVVFREWLDKFGKYDELVFIALRTSQTLIKFIPAEPLEIASGYAWGAAWGAVYCIFGNLIGTVLIWIFARKYGRRFVEFFIPLETVESFFKLKNTSNIYLLLFFFYVIPGLPKDIFTYISGLLPIKFLPFIIVTGIARIPSVLSSTICGATLAEKNYFLSAMILIVTILLAVIGSVIYASYIKRKNKIK